MRCERVSAGANESLKIVTEIDIQKLREDFSRSGNRSKWFMHLQHLDSTIELLNTQQKKAYSNLVPKLFLFSRNWRAASRTLRKSPGEGACFDRQTKKQFDASLSWVYPSGIEVGTRKGRVNARPFLILNDRGYFSELTSTGTPFSVSQGDFGLAFTISKIACIGRHSRVPLSDTTNGRSSAAG